MPDGYYFGAYWGNRPEDCSSCARRVHAWLASLTGVDETLTRWYGLGGSREQALRHEVEVSQNALRALLSRGRNRRDATGEPISELGFAVRLWNGGGSDEACSISVHCGGHASTKLTWVPNSVVLGLPEDGPAAQRMLVVPVLSSLVRVAAEAFDPDWAVVSSTAHVTEERDGSAPLLAAGWLTYLSARAGVLPPLPGGADVRELPPLGSLVVSAADRRAALGEAGLQLAGEIRRRLAAAGLPRVNRGE